MPYPTRVSGNAMPLPTFLSPILRATVYQGSFRSAIRSLAERDRGLFPISSSCGIIGFFVNTRKMTFPAARALPVGLLNCEN
jgi:hypothetical protein